jgi:hypothetical protein
MIATDDKIILGGNYARALHSSIFLHETDVDTFEFKISQDISLLNVSLQVPVFYDFVPAWPWGFKISYRNVRATMVNSGNDIIQSVTLHYKEPSTCTCGGFDQHEWKFEAINLAPGAGIDLNLGDFDIACIGSSPSMFCLTVLPGDEYLETNTSNNQFCKSVQSFYVSNTEPNQSQFYIYPNPTSDLIRIEMENSFSAVACVSNYNLHGRMVKRFTLEQSMSDVAVNDLQAGIYFLYLSIQGQPDQWSKFIVTR